LAEVCLVLVALRALLDLEGWNKRREIQI